MPEMSGSLKSGIDTEVVTVAVVDGSLDWLGFEGGRIVGVGLGISFVGEGSGSTVVVTLAPGVNVSVVAVVPSHDMSNNVRIPAMVIDVIVCKFTLNMTIFIALISL